MQEVGEITAPTLILTGMNDLMTPPRYAQYLANKIPNARLVLIPDAGHMLMLEKPQIVARELLDFLLRLQ
jgi:pimeloyl-ACP methyl ester carboxylesterase